MDKNVEPHQYSPSSSHELPMEQRAKVVPSPGKHRICTHFPKDQNCDVCLRTKITRASCRRRTGTVVPKAEHFGDLFTADHKVLSEGCEPRNHHRYAVVATQWIQSYPCETKTSQETQKSQQKFLEPTTKPKVIYTDTSLEFGKACEDLSRNHCTSTPHRSETHGIAERAVRRVKEGTSAVLLQSGLDENWWADSMECCCYLRKIQDLLSDGKTPHERRVGMPSNGVIPFGAMVEYHPISAKGRFEPASIRHKSLARYIPRSCLVCGGDASELHARRLNAKEVLTPMKGEIFIFPVADGTFKISGGDQALRTSSLIRDNPDRGEEQHDLRGESDGSSSTPLRDSSPDDGEAKSDFWSISGDFIYRHHVEPRVKLHVPTEESSPIPLKYIDVTRTTDTTLDVMSEKHIDDYCNIDGERELSNA